MHPIFESLADIIQADDAGPSGRAVYEHLVFNGMDTGSGIKLRFSGCSYGKVPVESVLAGEASPVEITLTSDGRGYHPGPWHEGAEAESVYVERWVPEGLAFHGFIDSETRRLVQAG